MKETAFDPLTTPAYTLAEAARYTKLPLATLRSWVVGRPYPRASGVAHFQPLIRPPTRKPPLLSFYNLIEAHVLRSLRMEHGVSLRDLRRAIDYAERQLKIDRLLLSDQLRTEAGRLFLDRYGELVDLSASGQIAMRRMFEEHLKRVEWGDLRLPVRLYPFISDSTSAAEKPIAIDPQIAFGRPVVARKSISTRVITDRIDGGESIEDLASDYGLERDEIEEAVLYERAA